MDRVHFPLRSIVSFGWQMFAAFVTIGAILTWEARAQQAGTPGAAPPSLNDVAGMIEKENAALLEKANELRLVIEAEAKARRVDLATAQNYLTTLLNIMAKPIADLHGLTTFRNTLQTPNEAIAGAAEKLAELGRQIIAERVKLIAEVLQTGRQQAVQLARTATKPGEIEPLLDTLTRLQQIMQLYNPDSLPFLQGNGFHSYIGLLRDLQAVFMARDSTDLRLFGFALQRFKMPRDTMMIEWTPIDAQNRVAGFLQPYIAAVGPAQSALDDALIARRPIGEISLHLAGLEKAENDLQETSFETYTYYSHNGDKLLDTYRTLVGLARAVEDHDLAFLRRNLTISRQNLASLGAERSNKLAPLLLLWQKQLDTAGSHVSEEQRATWPARLAAVKKPAELEAIADEMRAAERESARERDPGFPTGLGEQLSALATAWADSNPTLLSFGSAGLGNRNESGQFTKEINDLWALMQRDVFSHVLHSPELLASPLADQPINTALDTFALSLAAAGEWRRLLLLLEYRSTQMPNTGNASPVFGDAITAIRSYFTGQNFELAEQWDDAALAYKAVLSTGAELGPIKAATERLKMLAKEHPKRTGSQDIAAPGRKPPRH